MFYCRLSVLSAAKRYISFIRNYSTAPETADKWDLLCGVCLERKPVITRPLNDLELSFSKFLRQIEDENSQKSEHEIRHEIDLKRAAEFKMGRISTEDMDKAIGQTAAEFEDFNLKELKKFQPASRVSEADEKNDSKSLERMLDKHLLLIIKKTLGKNKLWILPQDVVQEGETLRQAAERILSANCGSKIRAKFFGNAPCGFYKYKYPLEIRSKNETIGAKIFFMKAQYLKGSFQETNTEDYSWASREELKKHFHAYYYKAVTAFLIDDEPVALKTR